MKNKKTAYRGGDLFSPKWVDLELIKETEVEERENDWFDDSAYINKGYEAIWVCYSKKEARRYGDVCPVDVQNSICVLEDGDGGYLHLRKKKT